MQRKEKRSLACSIHFFYNTCGVCLFLAPPVAHPNHIGPTLTWSTSHSSRLILNPLQESNRIDVASEHNIFQTVFKYRWRFIGDIIYGTFRCSVLLLLCVCVCVLRLLPLFELLSSFSFFCVINSFCCGHKKFNIRHRKWWWLLLQFFFGQRQRKSHRNIHIINVQVAVSVLADLYPGPGIM